MTMLLNHVCDDVLRLIVHHIDVCSTFKLRSTCRRLHSLLDDDLFKWIAHRLYGARFWERARARTRTLSRPLRSWRAELRRLEVFQEACVRAEGRRIDNERLYYMWHCMEESVSRRAAAKKMQRYL